MDEPQKYRCTQRGFLGVFGGSGKPSKSGPRNTRGGHVAKSPKTREPPYFRGLPELLVHFGPKITPNLAALGLGIGFGPKIGFPASFCWGENPQNRFWGLLASRKRRPESLFLGQIDPKPHYARPWDRFAPKMGFPPFTKARSHSPFVKGGKPFWD